MSTSIRQIFEDFMGETMGENSDLDFANGNDSFSFAETAAELAESLVSSIFVDASVGWVMTFRDGDEAVRRFEFSQFCFDSP